MQGRNRQVSVTPGDVLKKTNGPDILKKTNGLLISIALRAIYFLLSKPIALRAIKFLVSKPIALRAKNLITGASPDLKKIHFRFFGYFCAGSGPELCRKLHLSVTVVVIPTLR